jgi:hypothetical protein
MIDLDRRLAPERLLGVVRRQLKQAAQALDPRWPPRDAAVHDARKRLKKARAALRLARPVLGERRFGRDNQRLRDCRPPAERAARCGDAADVVEADAARSSASAGGAHRASGAARALHARFVVVRSVDPVHRAVTQALQAARADARGSIGDAANRRGGLRRIYRQGRRALAAARQRPTPAHLHEWRKQTKYLYHALDIVGAAAVRDRGLARRVHDLSDVLGRVHDLHVLHTRLADPRVPLQPHDRRAILAALDARMLAGRQRALRAGAVIYRRRPRAFVAKLPR